MNGAIDRINLGFGNLTKDMRIQTVIIAFLFGRNLSLYLFAFTYIILPLLIALTFHKNTNRFSPFVYYKSNNLNLFRKIHHKRRSSILNNFRGNRSIVQF